MKIGSDRNESRISCIERNGILKGITYQSSWYGSGEHDLTSDPRFTRGEGGRKKRRYMGEATQNTVKTVIFYPAGVELNRQKTIQTPLPVRTPEHPSTTPPPSTTVPASVISFRSKE